MENNNPFGIQDDGKTAGLLSYFFVLGWSMAYFAFHQYDRNQLSSFHLRQTLLLYLAYLFTRFAIPLAFGAAGMPVALFSAFYFTIPINALFITLWAIGLRGAMSGEEMPIPIFGDAAQRIFANLF